MAFELCDMEIDGGVCRFSMRECKPCADCEKLIHAFYLGQRLVFDWNVQFKDIDRHEEQSNWRFSERWVQKAKTGAPERTGGPNVEIRCAGSGGAELAEKLHFVLMKENRRRRKRGEPAISIYIGESSPGELYYVHTLRDT